MAAGILALVLGPEIFPRLRSGGFPINSVASAPDFNAASWRLKVDGLVRRPLTLTFTDFTALPQVEETKDFTCVEGWTVPGVRWKGVRLRELMLRADLDPRATHLVFHSGDGAYSDSLTIAEALHPAVLMAQEMNGQPLTPDHGRPLRLLVPGNYGYKSVKWVVRVESIAAGAAGYQGYWEQRGYPAEAEIDVSPADAPLEPGPAELEPQGSEHALNAAAAPSPPEARLLRFLPVERVAHWTHATFFLLAFTSGLLTWIPSTRVWMAGSRQAVTHLHGGMGVFMIAVPLLLFLVVDHRQLANDVREVDLWDADDKAWFSRALRAHTLLRREMPPQGRFNAGQKADSIIVAAMATGLAGTGSLLLAKPHVPAWLVSRALILHQVLAAAAIALFVGHLLHTFSTRHGRDSLRAMAGGTMSASVARERHEKWWRREGEQASSGDRVVS